MDESAVQTKNRTIQVRITVRGIVQGVGFRPFLSGLAQRLSLSGTVQNTVRGVRIEVDGPEDRVSAFADELLIHGNYAAHIQEHEIEDGSPSRDSSFHILPSDSAGSRCVWITPDFATCDDCRAEIFDPDNRRYRYPFNSCAVCGPRYSILEQLPFDRKNTVMRQFPLCADCEREYTDPENRRFHAQTISCPRCGPRIESTDSAGTLMGRNDTALAEAILALRKGRIVALQGLGGFQLLVDATDGPAVQRLRDRKHRAEKPLAVLFSELTQLREHCDPTAREVELLQSPASPIVLVHKRVSSRLAEAVAPGNPCLGAMIPYTPLHHLLMSEVKVPLVATSGNLSGEPICISPEEARARLGGVADLFLSHDRAIVRPVDDSVVRTVAGRSVCLRSARGYAPVTLPLPVGRGITALATGAQMKSSAAIVVADHVMVSQHLGELDCPPGVALLRRWGQDVQDLYQFSPDLVVHDDHPNYASTEVAGEIASSETMLESVQHHHAHVAACMLEHSLREPVMGLAWDGTGFGSDGTVWGGEFLIATPTGYRRVAHFLPFPLPGGDSAVREPRRAALGLLWSCRADGGSAEFAAEFAARTFTEEERRVLHTMLEASINAPLTSSVGRLYDAVAALLGLRQRVTFEGQAAMELEFLAAGERNGETYPFRIESQSCNGNGKSDGCSFGLDARYELSGDRGELCRPEYIIDWRPMIEALLSDRRTLVSGAEIAGRFQRTLVEIAADVIQRFPDYPVVLSGGCFQNRGLTEGIVERLEACGRKVFFHERIPPNDGGIAAGQAYVAVERKANVPGYSR